MNIFVVNRAHLSSVYMSIRSRICSRFDVALLLLTIFFLFVSLLMVYSSSAFLSGGEVSLFPSLLFRHLVSVLLGLCLLSFISAVPISWIKKSSPWVICIAIVMLVLVLIPSIGKSAGGAERWIYIGHFRFQPSELVRVFVVLYFASYISRHEFKMFGVLSGIVIPMFVVGVVAFLLLLEPDFGSTVVIVSVVFTQLLISSRLVHLCSVSIGAACAFLFLALVEPYRFRRIEAFWDPFKDPKNNGYQLIQSLIAVGSGCIFGKGLGAGEQKLHYLPAAHTDFIYAVIAEEGGIFAALLVLCAFLLFAYRGLRLAYALSSDLYLCALSIGLTMLIVLPAMLNIGVVLGLLPTKGLVLPLISFGGTAMVTNLVVVGILINVSREVDTNYWTKK